MRVFAIASTAACLLGLSGLAHAVQLASPAIYGGYTQNGAECWVRNDSSKPLSVVVQLYDESGNPLPSGTSCSSPIDPGSACVTYLRPVANGVAFACSATVPGNGKTVRGTMILTDANGLAVRSADLR
jgi:hypothetical protein